MHIPDSRWCSNEGSSHPLIPLCLIPGVRGFIFSRRPGTLPCSCFYLKMKNCSKTMDNYFESLDVSEGIRTDWLYLVSDFSLKRKLIMVMFYMYGNFNRNFGIEWMNKGIMWYIWSVFKSVTILFPRFWCFREISFALWHRQKVVKSTCSFMVKKCKQFDAPNK